MEIENFGVDIIQLHCYFLKASHMLWVFDLSLNAFLKTHVIVRVAFSELMAMIQYIRPFLALVGKAKAAKLVKTLVDLFLNMEAATGKEVSLKALFKCYGLIFIFVEHHYC